MASRQASPVRGKTSLGQSTLSSPTKGKTQGHVTININPTTTSSTTSPLKSTSKNSSTTHHALAVKGVLDLTFLEIATEADLFRQITEKMASARPSSLESPLNSTTVSTVRQSAPNTPHSPHDDRVYGPKALRLGNNEVTCVSILISLPRSLCNAAIQWLDLSFNHITRITPEFVAAYPNLTTLYLHANDIKTLPDIRALANFKSLRSLQLYGNPVEEKKHYRNYVLFYCPELVSFDKSPVTSQQRYAVEVWARTFRNKLNPVDE